MKQTVEILSLNLWSLEEGTMCMRTEKRATNAMKHMAKISNFLSSANGIHLRLCIPLLSPYWVTNLTQR